MILRSLLLAGVALVAIAAGGCGSAPQPAPVPTPETTPTPSLPAGTVLTFVSGQDNAPVPGGTVRVGSSTLNMGWDGKVVLAETAFVGTELLVDAPGFLRRETRLRASDGTRFTLWPDVLTVPRIDTDYTGRLVYTGAWSDDAPFGAESLERPSLGGTEAVLVLGPSIAEAPEARWRHELAAYQLNEVLLPHIHYSVATARPSKGIWFDVSLNPSDSTCLTKKYAAYASLQTSSGEVVGGQIVYCSSSSIRSPTVSHEVGHTFGLNHSPDTKDLMHGGNHYDRRGNFFDGELFTIGMMLQRRPGNRYPDSDLAVAAFSGDRTRVYVCE